jgi:hypothetical protein
MHANASTSGAPGSIWLTVRSTSLACAGASPTDVSTSAANARACLTDASTSPAGGRVTLTEASTSLARAGARLTDGPTSYARVPASLTDASISLARARVTPTRSSTSVAGACARPALARSTPRTGWLAEFSAPVAALGGCSTPAGSRPMREADSLRASRRRLLVDCRSGRAHIGSVAPGYLGGSLGRDPGLRRPVCGAHCAVSTRSISRLGGSSPPKGATRCRGDWPGLQALDAKLLAMRHPPKKPPVGQPGGGTVQ